MLFTDGAQTDPRYFYGRGIFTGFLIAMLLCGYVVPNSSRLDYLNDASYFGEDKTLSALAVEEKKALCQAFNEGVQAEKTARNTI